LDDEKTRREIWQAKFGTFLFQQLQPSISEKLIEINIPEIPDVDAGLPPIDALELDEVNKMDIERHQQELLHSMSMDSSLELRKLTNDLKLAQATNRALQTSLSGVRFDLCYKASWTKTLTEHLRSIDPARRGA